MAEQASPDEDAPPVAAELSIDRARFARSPSASQYRFGVVRRGDEVACFRIEDNPDKGNVIPLFAGTFSESYALGGERPQFGPIDRHSQRLVKVPLTPDLCGTLISEFASVESLKQAPEKQRRHIVGLGGLGMKGSS